MFVSSLMSPYAAFFEAFAAKEHSSPARLSPKAAEFVFTSTTESTTSELSPYAFPFFACSTSQAESELSPQAVSFTPVSTHETSPQSGLSPHAATFIIMPTDQVPYNGNIGAVRAKLPLNYNPALWRIESAIKSCQTALNVQHKGLEQHEKEFARHYDEFIKWKYFERYDEPQEYLDTECVQYLAEARNFRCAKCQKRTLELKQQFDYTSDKYRRLIFIHDQAVDEINSSPTTMHW